MTVTKTVPGLPVLGNALDMARDPARFFARAYREHGPVFRIKLLNRRYTVIAGADAANFMGTRDGRECLRSKEFWQDFLDEYGGTRALIGEDGDSHKELRDIMRRGLSRGAIKGRTNELVAITDRVLERDWKAGAKVPVVHAMQYLVTDQLGTILTGSAPLEYVPAIRTMIVYLLNVLVTRQRPKVMLRTPKYRKAKSRVFELSDRMLAELCATVGTKPDEERTFVDDLVDVHLNRPGVLPESDMTMALTTPYVAGLDTVASTTAAFVYSVLKHPEVLEKVRREADELFADGDIADEDIRKIPSIRYALMETMRLYPVAVALPRTATRDFEFAGHAIKRNEMVWIATTVPHFLAEHFPDPEKFDIARYEKPRAEHLQPGAYSPYGRGPHTCVGKGFADVQMAISMARLFHRLDLELESPNYKLAMKTAPTPGPAMSFKVRVKGYRN